MKEVLPIKLFSRARPLKCERAKMNELYFSLGTIDDVYAIVEINNSYFESDDASGFLVIRFDEAKVKNQIDEEAMRFYLAKDATGYLLGYAEVGNSIDLKLLDDITWINGRSKELAESILSGPYIFVKQLAVRNGYQRIGVAGFIYRNIEEHVGCPIVVFAAEKPKRNEPSIRFHEKNGYVQVARLYRTHFGEFENYESLFYVKIPKK